MIDNRENTVNHHNPKLIAGLCDRRFGIGGDGIMFLQNKEGFDFEMVYYNADGQRAACAVTAAGVLWLRPDF